MFLCYSFSMFLQHDFLLFGSSIVGGADGPDKVFVGGLPYYLTEVQIKELLESFGYAFEA